MKLIPAVIAAALALAFGSTEARAASWPAKCQAWSCVNTHLNDLNQRTHALRASVRLANTRAGWLEDYVFGCLSLGVAPIGQFTDYAFRSNLGVSATALDYSTVPDFYALAFEPSCLDEGNARQGAKAGPMRTSFRMLALSPKGEK